MSLPFISILYPFLSLSSSSLSVSLISVRQHGVWRLSLKVEDSASIQRLKVEGGARVWWLSLSSGSASQRSRSNVGGWWTSISGTSSKSASRRWRRAISVEDVLVGPSVEARRQHEQRIGVATTIARCWMIFGFCSQTTAIVEPKLRGRDRALLDDFFFPFLVLGWFLMLVLWIWSCCWWSG